MNSVADLHSRRCLACGVLVICTLGLGSRWAAGTAPTMAPQSATSEAADELAEIMVETQEPRYVAPTLRDRIGRIWAPVFINGRGPFRLVLDTGASRSAVTSTVALALGIPTDQSPEILLRGVTGSAKVPTIKVDTLTVGDVAVDSPVLPIVPDAMGGAQGVLGSEGLANKRIFIDFRHDQISITYSRDERAGVNFHRIPFSSLRGQLIVVSAYVGQIATKAIIDTGGQTTIANMALREALARRNLSSHGSPDQIMGATLDIKDGTLIPMPAIEIGPVQIVSPGVTFADMPIFKQWSMTRDPAILIGMDALGTLNTLIIDYRRHELQLRTM